MHRRLLLTVTVAVVVLSVAAPLALAAKPMKGTFSATNTGTSSKLCAFPVNVASTFTVTYLVWDDGNGNVQEKDSVTEQDTFTANGKTVQTYPYRFNAFYTVVGGNLTSWVQTGVEIKLRLPSGALLIDGGWADAYAQIVTNGGDFIFADRGVHGDISLLCAALT